MAQVTATADLQGVANAGANGDLVLSVAVGVSGEASTTGEFEGDFTGGVALLGEAGGVVGLTKVSRLIGAIVAGDAALTGSLVGLMAASAAGDAAVAAPADLVVSTGAGPLGEASVAVAPSEVLFQGGSSVQGDASVAASASGLFAVSGIAQRGKFSSWSVEFDGTDEYVTAGDVLGYDRTDPFSISCWVKTTYNGGAHFVVAKGAASPEGYWLLIRSDGLPVLALMNTWVTNDLRVRANDLILNDGVWHHLVATHGGLGTAASVKLYMDGVEAGSYTVESDTLTSTILNTASFRIGTRENGYPAESFQGVIDEVGIYSKALTGPEVTWIYNAAVPNDLGDGAAPSDLAAWWRMGDGDVWPTLFNQVMGEATFPTIPDTSGLPSALVLTDASGNDLDGTMINMESTDIVYGGPYAYAPVNEPIHLTHDGTHFWQLDSNYSLAGVPAVLQFDSVFKLYSWTPAGTASETAIRIVFDGTDAWVGGNDASGNAQLKKMTTSTPPTFSSGYSVSSNSFTTMVYGGGYLWVADSAGIWRVDPANPSGPHTSVATLARVIDMWFDDITTNYGDSQPRLWALTDETGDKSIHRYELATPAQDAVLLVHVDAEPRAITVGDEGHVYLAYHRSGANTIGQWTTDPLAPVVTNTNINSYIVSPARLLDIVYDARRTAPLLVYGQYKDTDPRARVIAVRTALTVERASIWDGNPWVSGPHPQLTLVDYVYAPAMAPAAGKGLTKVNSGYVTGLSHLQPYKLPSHSRQFLVFDGVNEYVDMGDVLDWDRDQPRSYSFWARTTMTTRAGVIISKSGSGDPEGFSIVINATGELGLELVKVFPDRVSIYSVGSTFNDGNWHHLCLTWSGSTGTASDCKMYFDGVEDTTLNVVSDTLDGSISNSFKFEVGDREVDQGTLPFDGDLDEVAVYDKKLSVAEVSAIYNFGSPLDLSTLGSAANLAAWWRMGEGIGGYNDATMVNMEAADNVVDVPRSSFCQYSLEFPYAADEYYDMGDVHAFEYTDDFSVSAWVQFTTPSGRSCFPLAKMGPSTLYRGWRLAADGASGKFNFALINDSGSGDYIHVETTDTSNDGDWHHVIATWSGSATPVAADLTIYVDGVAQTPVVLTDALSGTIVSADALTIGNFIGGPTDYVDGSITEVSIWNKTITAAEAAWVYNSGLPRDLKAVGQPYSTQSVQFQEANIQLASGGNILHLDRTDDFSWSLWFRTDYSTTAQQLFSKSIIKDSQTIGWWGQVTTAGNILFAMINTWGSSDMRVQTTSLGWNDGSWHHLAITHDSTVGGGGKAASCKVYVDGVNQTLSTLFDTLTATMDTRADFRLGDSEGATGQRLMEGYLDEVALHGKVLSQADVDWVYNIGNTRDLQGVGAPSNLLRWWQMGEALSGNEVIDEVATELPKYSPLTKSTELNDGTTDEHFNFGGTPALDFIDSDPVTMGVWVKTTNTASRQTLLCKHWTATADSTSYLLEINGGWGGILRLFRGGSGDMVVRSVTGISGGAVRGLPPNDGVWHLILFAYNGAGFSNIWIDATLRGSSSSSENPGTPAQTGELWFGDYSAGYPLRGNLCHGFVYNKELSTEEIQDIYGEGVPQDLSSVGPTGNLVFWSALGDGAAVGSGNVPELSGGGNHGELINGESGDFVSVVPNDGLDLTLMNGAAVVVDAPSPILLTALAGWWRVGTKDNPAYQLRDAAADPTVMDTTGVKDQSRYNAHTALVNMSATDISVDTPGGVAEYSLDFNSEVDDYFSYKYLDFSGYGYVYMGNVFGFERTDSFSVSFWLRWQGSGLDYFMGQQDGSTTYRGWRVYGDASEYLTFDLISDNVTSDKISVQVQSALPSNTNISSNYAFQHIVITYDGSSDAGGITIYRNGLPQTVVPLTNNLTATIITTASFQLANVSWNTTAANRLQGNLDEVGVYNKVLSAAEATWLYNEGVPNDLADGGAPSNLVSWYRMGDGDTLPTITDNAGSNDGTVGGSGTAVGVVYPPGADKFNEQLYDNVYREDHHFENSASVMWSFWVKTSCSYGTVLQDGSSSSVFGLGIYLLDGYVHFAINDDVGYTNATYGYTIRSLVQVDDGAWHHVMIGQYQAKGANIWVDGVSGKTTLVAGLLNTIGTSGKLMLGGHRMSEQPVNGLKGKLAEVSVWCGYLGQDGVDAVYNSGSPPDLESLSFSKRLRGWWRMGSSPGVPGVPVNIVAADERKRGDAPGEEAWSTRALDFGGYDEHLNLGNRFAYEWTIPFSVSFWSKVQTPGYIMGVFKSATNWPGGWSLSHYHTVHFTLNADPSSSGRIWMQLDDRHLVMGQEWYHVCMTYDGSGNYQGVTLYVDGYKERLDQYVYTAFLASAVTSHTLTFGRASYTSYNNGIMDEVSFWGKELTEVEALELYNDGVPADLTAHSAFDSIDAWWRMGEGAADAVMVDMEAGDIIEDSPYVQAGGGSNFTATALGDDQISSDVAGDAVTGADARLTAAAAVAAVGETEMGLHTIVRPQTTPLPVPDETVPDEDERLIGYQPGRETPPRDDKMSVLVDVGRIREQNRAARRFYNPVRKDTGSSSTKK